MRERVDDQMSENLFDYKCFSPMSLKSPTYKTQNLVTEGDSFNKKILNKSMSSKKNLKSRRTSSTSEPATERIAV